MTGGFLELLLGDSVTRLVFFPTLAAIPLLFLRKAPPIAVKYYGLAVALIELGLMAAFAAAHWDAAGMLVRDPVLPWIQLPDLSIVYEVGLDGISLPLVLLTGLLLLAGCVIFIVGGWRQTQINLANSYPVLGISYAWLYGVALVFGVALIFPVCNNLLRAWRGDERELTQDLGDRIEAEAERVAADGDGGRAS